MSMTSHTLRVQSPALPLFGGNPLLHPVRLAGQPMVMCTNGMPAPAVSMLSSPGVGLTGTEVCGLLPVNEDYRKRIQPRPYVI